MALLPQGRPQQIALIVIVLALGALYGFHTYWYTPRIVAIEALQTRLTQLQDQNRQAQVAAARGGEDLEERLALYERHIERLEQLIPASEEVPALLNSMALEARQAGVELASMGPGPALAGAYYTEQSYEIAVVGEFHQIGRFLSAVASLPRIVTPVDLEIEPFTGRAPREDMVAPVTARFRVQTYVAPARSPLQGLPMGGGL